MKDKQKAVIISTTIGLVLFGATYYFFIEKPKQDAQNAAPGNTSPGMPSTSGGSTIPANDPTKQVAISYLKGYLNPSNELLAYMNSLATAFLQAWVTGLKNNQIGFYYGGDYYSVQTGKKV